MCGDCGEGGEYIKAGCDVCCIFVADIVFVVVKFVCSFKPLLVGDDKAGVLELVTEFLLITVAFGLFVLLARNIMEVLRIC